MSTFAVVVIVVGAGIGISTSVVMKSVEPATDRTRHSRAPMLGPHRPRPLPARTVRMARRLSYDGIPVEPIRWWDRVRAGLALGAIAVGLGCAVAGALGLVAVALYGLLRNAVG